MSRPTTEEIAAFTARLRELSHAGRDADQADIDQFLADKNRLIGRIDPALRDVDDSALGVADAHARVRLYLDGVNEHPGATTYARDSDQPSAQAAFDDGPAGLW